MAAPQLQRAPDRTKMIRADRVQAEEEILGARIGHEKRFEMRLGNGALAKCLLALGSVVLIATSVSWAADDAKDQSDIGKRIVKSTEVLNEIMATPDKAIPDKVMDNAK